MPSRRSRRARATALATITLTAATALFASAPATAAPMARVSAVSAGVHTAVGADLTDVQQLYIAYFGRPADAAGLTSWMTAIAGGGIGIVDIAQSFSASSEYSPGYQTNESAHITAIYLNLFGRAPSFLPTADWLSLATAAADENARWELVTADEAKADAAEALAQAAAANAAAASANLTSSQAALDAAVQAATAASTAASAARAAADAAQTEATAAAGPNASPELQATADRLAAAALVAEAAATSALEARETAAVAVTAAAAAHTTAVQKASELVVAATAARTTATQGKLTYSQKDADTPPTVPATLPAGDFVGVSQPVAAGSLLFMSAIGFKPGTEVAFGIHSDPLAIEPITADASGLATTLFVVPDSFTGDHSLVAVGTGADGAPRTVRLDVAVSAPAAAAAAAAAASPALAETGVDPALPLGIGALLLAAGSFVVYRRRTLSSARG